MSATLHLIHASAQHNKSKVAWCVDIDPPVGGDPVKARAMPLIVQRHLPALLAADAPGAGAEQRVTLLGWSHGGAEALRTAEAAPDLIPMSWACARPG